MIGEMLDEEIEFVFERATSNVHYEITPYSFSPKLGKKFSPILHVDLGQGILRTIEEHHATLHPELNNINGYLVKE
jgi:UDP-glucose 4-epimerase